MRSDGVFAGDAPGDGRCVRSFSLVISTDAGMFSRAYSSSGTFEEFVAEVSALIPEVAKVVKKSVADTPVKSC